MTMYQIVEHDKKLNKTYMMGFDTEAELSSFLNGRQEMSEDKNYSIVAWKVNNEGYGYIDLERIWNRMGLKVA